MRFLSFILSPAEFIQNVFAIQNDPKPRRKTWRLLPWIVVLWFGFVSAARLCASARVKLWYDRTPRVGVYIYNIKVSAEINIVRCSLYSYVTFRRNKQASGHHAGIVAVYTKLIDSAEYVSLVYPVIRFSSVCDTCRCVGSIIYLDTK